MSLIITLIFEQIVICHLFEMLFYLDFSLVLQENFSTGVDTRNGQSAAVADEGGILGWQVSGIQDGDFIRPDPRV